MQEVNINFEDAGGNIHWMLEGFDHEALRIASTKAGAKAIVKQAAEGSYDVLTGQMKGPYWSFRHALGQSDWKAVAQAIQSLAEGKL